MQEWICRRLGATRGDLVQQMAELIEEGTAEGVLNEEEEEMLLSILSFRKTMVREVMALEAYAESFKAFKWPWYMPGVEEYEGVLGESAFGGGKVWGENADRHFPDAAALTGWIDQPCLVPFLGYLEEELKGAFRDEVVERMMEATACGDGRFFETFRRVNVRAVKGG